MTLRKVQRPDNKHLSTLIKAVFDEYDAPKEGTDYSDSTTDDLQELFKNSKSVLWVVEEDGQILGCSYFKINNEKSLNTLSKEFRFIHLY